MHITKRQLQNTAVISLALAAALLAVYINTDWLSKNKKTVERERCYGIARAEKNDCANSQHACASQSKLNSDPDEFIMVPKGLCKRIIGGKSA